MTTLRTLLQQALDALTSHQDLLGTMHLRLDAITALREALAAPEPEPEPVALESVHLTRDTRGMCVVRVNGRLAIRDNGDIIDHMATLEWFAQPAPVPLTDTETHAELWKLAVRKGLVTVRSELIDPRNHGTRVSWMQGHDKACDISNEAAAHGIAASPAAPVVREPLRDDAFHAWVEETSADHPNLLERQEFRDAMYNAWINGYNTRVDEQAHGITGASK